MFLFGVTQAETVQADLRPEQQAKQEVKVHPFFPFNGQQQNYLYVSSGTSKVSVGDNMSLKLSITASEPAIRDNIKHITYVVRQRRHEWCGVSVERWKT